MARFDLYRPRGSGALLLDVQHHYLDAFRTRVVIPLVAPTAALNPIRDLHPIFAIDGIDYVLATQLVAAIPKRELGTPIANLEGHRDAITKALDVLLTGF